MDGGVDVGVWANPGHFRYWGRERVRVRMDQWKSDVFRRLMRIWVLVNISQYLYAGRFSAVSFQVIGHIKAILVFLFGFICFNAPITSKNVAGCTLAVIGMVYYSQAMNKQKEEEAKAGMIIHSGVRRI